MRIAIYSRKSKLTDKGESIENQINLCREYAIKNFDTDVFDRDIFEDEGFSGKDTERPAFQSLLKSIRNETFDIVICYRLDRISRNISDFSALIDDFEKYNVSFVSIKEHFDTTTPMGRAMMFIASVFAQLERETTAERIRDNMLQLAKTGRWLGGITPLGYKSDSIVCSSLGGKYKKRFKLTPIKSEINKVLIIFNQFLEMKSLTKVQSYCLQNGIKTRKNINFTSTAIKSILTNPVYAIGDKYLYDYFTSNGYSISSSISEFNNVNGIIAYNKTSQKKHATNQIRKPNEWIIAVGEHNGIISGKKWVEVQNLIKHNSSKNFRTVKNTSAILSGILRCKDCGSFMRPRTGRINKDGVMQYYYMCELKEKSKKHLCSSKNIKGNLLDQLVLDEIKKLSLENSYILLSLTSRKSIIYEKSTLHNEIIQIENVIKNNKKIIKKLINTLTSSDESSAAKYFIEQIEELDKEQESLNSRLLQLNQLSEEENPIDCKTDKIKAMLENLSSTIDALSVEDKRNLIKSLTKSIVWDGKNIDIILIDENVSVDSVLQMKY
ncbi:recombinase family protein [Anaerovorax odorimutans]|uniref:recombinase family protein n=1 Tax=Anaerovorax odorimutans TaxID=109327 RepID=UPI0004004B63|nr:recombinase family protein [Anaerovorax odorimutans]